MGYLYVNRRYKGIIVQKFDFAKVIDTVPDDWFPTQDWIDSHFPDADSPNYCCQSKQGKLVALACLQNVPYYFFSHKPYSSRSMAISQFAATDVDNIWADPVYRDDVLRSALAIIFCYVHNYPVGSFAWLCDYFCTEMFVCSLQFPPAVYDAKLAQMTETSMAEELSEFLSTVTGDKYDPRLQWCLEYTKE